MHCHRSPAAWFAVPVFPISQYALPFIMLPMLPLAWGHDNMYHREVLSSTITVAICLGPKVDRHSGSDDTKGSRTPGIDALQACLP